MGYPVFPAMLCGSFTTGVAIVREKILNKKLLIFFTMTFTVIVSHTTCFALENSSKFREVDSEHFKFVLFDNLSPEIIPDISQHLEENYARILDDLQVLNLPKVTIKIWGSKERFLEVQESSIGKRYPRSFGYVWWGEVRLRYRGARTAQTTVHEFVHVVSQHINATVGNNPRLLWEAVAIYESRFPHFDPSKISYMKGGNYSSLSDLNRDFNRSREIYQVGHTLIEYIVQKWGNVSVIQLIKTNGNIESVLKISTDEFEKGWYQYIEQKYLNDK